LFSDEREVIEEKEAKLESEKERETFEQVAARFPDVDEAAKARAAARVAKGVDAAHAMNDEAVWSQLTRAYQPR
jgi:hypothetical protein